MAEATGVTKEFLEKALKTPIEKFEAGAGSELGDGFTCSMFKVRVWTKASPEEPLDIVVKCFPENESRQGFLDQSDFFIVELRFYDSVIPELNKLQEELPAEERFLLPFAPFIHGQYLSPEERKALGRPLKPVDNCIIMPDLRTPRNGEFQVRNRFLGFDLDHMKLVVEGQATLHATSWVYKQRKGIKSLKEAIPEFHYDMRAFWKSYLSVMELSVVVAMEIFADRPDLVEGLKHLQNVCSSAIGLYFDFEGGQTEKGHTKNNIARVPTPATENEEPWNVLLHGDCWSNNVMFRYDKITGKPVQALFIDLQISQENDPIKDLAYTLFVNLEPTLRRQHLSSLLRLYFDRFSEVCDTFSVPYLPGWSWEEFNRRFRRGGLWGALIGTGVPTILKNPEELVNFDEAVRNVESKNKEPGTEKDGMGNVMDFFKDIGKTKKLLPAARARMTGIFEDLVNDGVL